MVYRSWWENGIASIFEEFENFGSPNKQKQKETEKDSIILLSKREMIKKNCGKSNERKKKKKGKCCKIYTYKQKVGITRNENEIIIILSRNQNKIPKSSGGSHSMFYFDS